MDRRKPDRRKRDQDQLLTDIQVAELAGVSINSVRKWRQIGVLPFVKVGRHPRVWLSTFQRVFHKPDVNGPWEQIGRSDKMPIAGNIRRKQ